MSEKSRYIRIRGARTHNLQNLSLDLPAEALVVLTGPSGSGKSSLAFDTLFAEGQRRYVESLSAYARQFLQTMDKPDVDSIDGLSPAIAIQQKSLSHNPRSTVGTITEVHDYLRLLFARVGVPHCPEHGQALVAQSVTEVVETILKKNPEKRYALLAPVVRNRKGEYHELLRSLKQKGYVRVQVNGEYFEIDQAPTLSLRQRHSISVVIDRFRVRQDLRQRLSESVEHAFKLGEGLCLLADLEQLEPEQLFSARHACPYCGFSVEEMEPRLFSFNSPKGACPTCDGLGVIPLAIENSENLESEENNRLFETCPDCQGARLNIAARQVRINNLTLPQLNALPINQLVEKLSDLSLSRQQSHIAEKILTEIQTRLGFLVNVGLHYLNLGRSAESLSGGESQRIRLASQIGSGLTGVLYVLDEPSIGLHPRDNDRLIKTLLHLKNLGNSVIVVEHDEETMRTADWLVDLGPGAGKHGGQIVASGTPAMLMANPDSLTGRYLSGQEKIAVPKTRQAVNPEKMLTLTGACGNNLQNISVSIPLGLFTVVTGVSGSGKSTLIHDTLYPVLAKKIHKSQRTAAPYQDISGLEHLNKVILIDQSPIGRTPRSNPATYSGVFTGIRELFASTPEARARGYKSGRFSFNVPGGRCPACDGDGVIHVEMHFLPDVYVTCEVCRGLRYNRETLDIHYKGKTIADILQMTVEEAVEFFAAIPSIVNKLKMLQAVGLDYLELGQNAVTLSGGEAQRVKLAKELARRDSGNTLYILDEPTTGLHFHDVAQLLNVLKKLQARGNSLIIIEHHLDVIKNADWIIDLGPEGGSGGGQILICGTPETVAACPASHTGRFLAPLLNKTCDKNR